MIGVSQFEARENDRDRGDHKVRKVREVMCFLKLNEEERICKMMEMFCLDITIFIETGGQPTTVARCYERALCAYSG